MRSVCGTLGSNFRGNFLVILKPGFFVITGITDMQIIIKFDAY